MGNEKQITFTVMVPVEITARNTSELSRMFRSLKEAGTSMFSTAGYRYDICTYRLLLRDIRKAFKSAKDHQS